MKALWAAAAYWPAWLGVVLGTFLLREIWALASGRSRDTLSAWVWRLLKVTEHQPMSSWDALHFLAFGAWLVMVVWLTRHFFYGGFR